MIQIDKGTERVNWKKIKAEYLAGDTSFRKLGEKYGIDYQVVARKAKAESWIELRDDVKNKVETKAKQKIVDKMSDELSDNVAVAAEIKKRLLLRLQHIEARFPIDATEVTLQEGNKKVVFRVRDLTGMYRDLMADEKTEKIQLEMNKISVNIEE